MRITSTRALLALTASASLSLVLGGCAGSSEPADSADAPTFSVSPSASASAAPAAHWTYEGDEGPDHWGELAGDYATCQTGTAQSPIDLSTASAVEGDELELEYGTVTEHVVDTGHTFQMAADDEAGVEYEGGEYSLVQMHFHDPSEHTIDGVAAPVEFHFVNQDAEGHLLVVGVLGVEGEENAAYGAFIDATTEASTDEVTGTVDLAAMLPADADHFAYSGSLTTPPCTEGVQWIVMQTPVELSGEQLAELQDAYDHNNRPVQPTGGRTVNYAPTEIEG